MAIRLRTASRSGGRDPEATTPDETPDETPTEAPPEPATRERRSLRLRLGDALPVTLLLAAHPRQAVLTAVAVGVAALLTGREPREVLVVAATVLVGQSLLGWHNDLADRRRDARHETPRKPVAQGRLDPGTLGFAIAVAVLLVVPLSISVGVTAGTYYLGSLVAGALGNAALRKGRFSFLTWATSFGLLVPYLSYGGWGGGTEGSPPQPAMIAVAALLGVGVHVVRSIWGLVTDDQDGWESVPLRLGRRLGATRLLLLSGGFCLACVAGLVVVGATVGLRQ